MSPMRMERAKMSSKLTSLRVWVGDCGALVWFLDCFQAASRESLLSDTEAILASELAIVNTVLDVTSRKGRVEHVRLQKTDAASCRSSFKCMLKSVGNGKGR